MKSTNKFNLPSVFERFEERHQHTTGGAKYSVTKLIDSPQIAHLRRKHWDRLSEDISDRAWAILGTAVHAILEQGAEDNQVVEQRFQALIDGIKVSGQVDLLTPNDMGMLLSDYKTVRAFSLQANPSGKPEWIRQLNCYAVLAELNDIKVTGIEVIAIVRDWSAASLERSNNYPKAPIIRIPLELWRHDLALDYLKDRVKIHESDSPVECTEEEMWARPPVFAVHEKTMNGSLKKRAKKLFNSRTEAELYSMDIIGSDVKERPQVYVRCDGNYCNVAEFCDTFYRRTHGSGIKVG